MKVVFAHDHVFRQDIDGNYYTAGSFNNVVWKRYLKHFNELTVVARLDDTVISRDNQYNKFNLSNTYFKQVPSLSGPIAQFKNKKVVKEILTKELEKSDALIARLPSETGNVAIEIAKKLKKPYIVEVVACVWDALWNHGSLQAKLYAPIAMRKMKVKVKNATNVIYVTNEFLQNRYPSRGKTECISNVEIEKVANDKILDSRVKRYQENGQLYTIGMIGSLKNKIKGIEVALKALAILNEKGIDFEFQVLCA